MITGHCECRRVQYEVDGEITDFSHCHCSQCRRLHGAAFATFAGIARDGFRYVSGEADVKVYASSERNDRVFCGECGSPILVDAKEEPETLYLSMSTVEDNPPHPPAYHAHVSSKAPWHAITDDLEQYDTYPPE
jgi:hypothetical protein